MAQSSWCDILGWNENHLDELRFLGYVYLKEAQYDIAKSFFEGLILLDPTNAYDFRTLGAIYLLQNDYDKAIPILSKALELELDHPEAKLNLAKARLFKGERSEGVEMARGLIKSSSPHIASDAEAIVLAYS